MRNSLKQKLIESLLLEGEFDDYIRFEPDNFPYDAIPDSFGSNPFIPPGSGLWIRFGSFWYWIVNDPDLGYYVGGDRGYFPGRGPTNGSTIWNLSNPNKPPRPYRGIKDEPMLYDPWIIPNRHTPGQLYGQPGFRIASIDNSNIDNIPNTAID